MSRLPLAFRIRPGHAVTWLAARASMRNGPMLPLSVAAASVLGATCVEGQVVIELGEGAIEVAAPAPPVDENVAEPAAEPVMLTPEEMARQQVEQMAAQYEPMVGRLLHDHLALLRTLHGDLPIEARRAIATAGEAAVKVAALRLSEALHKPQQVVPPQPQQGAGGVVNAIGRAFGVVLRQKEPAKVGDEPDRNADPFPDPGQIVIDAIHTGLVEQIGEERAGDFVDELSRREQRQREATVRRLVGILDDDLFLAAKQRVAIEEALVAGWDEGIVMAIDQQIEVDGQRHYLGLPYELILPHLSPAQQSKLGDGKRSREMFQGNRQSMMQTQFFRRANRSQQAELDPWWFE